MNFPSHNALASTKRRIVPIFTSSLCMNAMFYRTWLMIGYWPIRVKWWRAERSIFIVISITSNRSKRIVDEFYFVFIGTEHTI